MGTGVSTVAVSLLVLGLTGSPAQAGLVTGLERFPYLVLALVAGVLVDRWDRRRTMVICDAARALLLASVAVALVLHCISFVQLCVVAVLEGTFFTVFSVAEAASLPSLVKDDQLGSAFAQREMAWSGSGIIASGLGGFLYQTGRHIPFVADAASYTLSVVSLLYIKCPLQDDRHTPPSRMLPELVEGLRWIVGQPAVLLLTFLSGGLDFVIGGTVLVLIVLARTMHGSPAAIGLMLSIGSAGPLLGYVVAPHIQRTYALRTVLVATLWVNLGLWLLYLVVPTPLVIGLVMAVAGGVASVYIVSDVAFRITSVPDELRGRLNGIFGVLPFGLQSVSLVVAGIASQGWGPRGGILLFSVLLALMALGATFSPALRAVSTVE